ncbi:restriction endonuclease subunit S [Erwinia pyrifoliae]|uniref:restriction endonuclease subunit S n=1 Tax=Erwinia pyrifoliae TaxID=79967 RepID=UPI00220409C5|nr:restriction endonuclease subunit S [Erwinia pyrifoliae]UWS29211.1 restriction endonuclease subunit S [Erwinia pyrifoliae]
MVNMAELPKYEFCKKSCVDWIGKIPTDWQAKRFKFLASITTGDKNTEDKQENGKYQFFVRSQMPEKIDTYTYDGEAILTAGDGAGVGRVYHYVKGKFDFHQRVYKFSDFREVLGKYLYNYFCVKFYNVAILGTAKSTVDSLRLPLIQDFQICYPADIKEQERIIYFLEKKTSEIDEAIAIKEKQISLLKERKQIIIQKAVTQGLDANAPMKDSGVSWIGKIPEHWEIRRSKFLFTQRKEKALNDDVQLSATQAYGVIPQEKYEALTGKRVVKIQFHLDKRKHVEKDDFVISMRSFQGGLERAWSCGCIRSSYVVLKALQTIDPLFYGYLLKLPSYIAALQQTASFIRDGQDLNFDNFSRVDLFIPPLEEQTAIANYVESFLTSSDEAMNLIEQQIEKLKEYKTTLINSAVTGKIKITPEMVE